jgi:hypothetical protein
MSSTSTTGDQSGFVGSWQLEITSPLGPQTATLFVDEDGRATLRGPDEFVLGRGSLDTIALNGDIFTAAVALKIQGMAIQANIEGRREGDNLSGSIRTNMPIVPAAHVHGAEDQSVVAVVRGQLLLCYQASARD